MFKLTIDCEDKNELITFAKATDYSSFLHEFREKLRSYNKHGIPEDINSPHDAIHQVWEEFHKILEIYNILITRDY